MRQCFLCFVFLNTIKGATKTPQTSRVGDGSFEEKRSHPGGFGGKLRFRTPARGELGMRTPWSSKDSNGASS